MADGAPAQGSWPSPPTAASSSQDRLPVLGEVIESIGFGPAQVRASLVGGGSYFADGAELLLIVSVTNSVAETWRLSPAHRGLIVTVVFIGVFLGNLASGPIGDSYGRRRLVVASFAGFFTFSVLSTFSAGVVALCVTRFFVGMSFGLGQPAWNTLAAEITPADWRVFMMFSSQNLFICGELYSCILLYFDDPMMKKLHWRRLLRLGAVPSAVFGIASAVFLQPSPTFLAASGQYDEAKRVLESMRDANSLHGFSSGVRAKVPVDFRVARSARDLPANLRARSRRVSWSSRRDMMKGIGVVFGPKLWSSTLIVMYCCFVLNFVYYGSMYAFPQVLAAKAQEGDITPAAKLLVGVLWELPGQALGILAGTYMSRKRNLKLYLFLTTLAFLCFALGLAQEGPLGREALTTAGYYGIKCFVDSGFIVVLQYSTEIYPTEARTTGSAINLGSGRVAAMVAPIIFEALHASTKGYTAFFCISCVLALTNLLVIDLLRFETQGRPLVDDVGDIEEEEREGGQREEEEEPLLPGRPAAEALLPEPLAPM